MMDDGWSCQAQGFHSSVVVKCSPTLSFAVCVFDPVRRTRRMHRA